MYDFDCLPDRRGSDSVKWNGISEDVIPMWVADMDFQAPPPVLEAVTERASHPYYGYPTGLDELGRIVIQHYEKVYQVPIEPEWIVWVPSVISGVVNALKMLGGTFMYSVPMYDHIRRLYAEANLPVIEVPLKKDADNHYAMDLEALEAAVKPEVTCLILCNPHNPVGRMYSKEELLELQAFCKKHDIMIISDEIHCEIALDKKHIPYFSLNEEAREYSVTLSGAGKICNIPGLPMGFAIIPDAKIRKKFIRQQDGLLPSGNIVTLAAYKKAYDGSCDQWKDELRAYLCENRDLAEKRFKAISEIQVPHNEGTYLLWLDCSALRLEKPAKFFMEQAQVKVSPGKIYGNSQCVRFNYGCPRKQLIEALDRMEAAIDRWRKNKD
ncbi:MAG: aminotransferase class I/II-fold pyridoxal phosphate-dependent enzyme [Lachnospiraceae bacterium]|nr:aminotransferase class I/II-fold pyridoxal phosphate-dependent enzyme [Lachnospiraceae bacterium]